MNPVRWCTIDEFDEGGGNVAVLVGGPFTSRVDVYALAAVFAREIPWSWSMRVIHRGGTWRVGAEPSTCVEVAKAAKRWARLAQRISSADT
jgi:hypothetical protein